MGKRSQEKHTHLTLEQREKNPVAFKHDTDLIDEQKKNKEVMLFRYLKRMFKEGKLHAHVHKEKETVEE